MLRESSYVELELEPGEAVSLARTAGWELTCAAGRIWLTEEGGGDVWLAASEGMTLHRPGRTVIEAGREGACLRLRKPRAWSAAASRHALPGKASAARTLPTSLPQPA